MQPTFKNDNGDTYIYGKKYVELLLAMIESGAKTKDVGKNRITIGRVIDNDEEYTVFVSLERL